MFVVSLGPIGQYLAFAFISPPSKWSLVIHEHGDTSGPAGLSLPLAPTPTTRGVIRSLGPAASSLPHSCTLFCPLMVCLGHPPATLPSHYQLGKTLHTGPPLPL